MKVIETDLPGVLIIEPRVIDDNRGFFMETWRQNSYEKAGISDRFVQDNLSFSSKGVLRGLHYQYPKAQGKLIYVLQGEVFDVAVDIRIGSPAFSQWVGVTLSAANRRQLYIPPGFAHGFYVSSESALISYKCTEYHDPTGERCIRWDDPSLAINWQAEKPVLSEKDRSASQLCETPREQLPVYKLDST